MYRDSKRAGTSRKRSGMKKPYKRIRSLPLSAVRVW